MADSETHYRTVLAADYLTMKGEFDALVRADKGLFQGYDLDGIEGTRVRALDLGAGPGQHAIALAELGYHVTAIDLSAELLAHLDGCRGNLPIDVRQGDLVGHLEKTLPGVQLVICLGDTLTHLPSEVDVGKLFGQAFRVLASKGQLLLTFRDLTAPPVGLDRFIPVRQTETRIMTCFLEDKGDHVEVHDLIYRKGEAGWELVKSSYPKLKLSEKWVRGQLMEAGFEIVRGVTESGQVEIMARKP